MATPGWRSWRPSGRRTPAAQLTLVADDLVATLAQYPTKDGRNVAVRALRRRLAFV